jgi:thiamine pyrophosphate-dependent acetolactate synthase large subunit-like protein
MTEPCGPVYIALDAGLQEEPLESPIPLPDPARFAPPTPPAADGTALATAARWLVEAERPVVVADYLGRSAEAVAALVELADLLALAVVDRGSRFNFPSTHRFDLTDAAGELLGEADVVLALDLLDLQAPLTTVDRTTRQVRSRLPAGARVIDLSTRDLLPRSWTQDAGGLHPADLAIVAETRVALPQLLSACRDAGLGTPALKPRIEARATRLEARHRALVDEARAEVERQWNSSPVSLPRLAMDLWDVVKDEDWVLVNRTLHWWTRRLWPWDRHDRYVGVSHGGSVGYGIGAAIGAALGRPGRLAINIQPDGDLLYTPSGLWTAAHHRVPMLIVMFNNRSYYNDEEHQAAMARHRGRPVERKGIGIHIQDPPVDCAALARSFGLHAEGPIEEPRDLRPALERAVRRAVEDRRPALVDVVTQPR